MDWAKFNSMWTLLHGEDTVISPIENTYVIMYEIYIYIYVIMYTVIYITHGYVAIVLVYIKCKF